MRVRGILNIKLRPVIFVTGGGRRNCTEIWWVQLPDGVGDGVLLRAARVGKKIKRFIDAAGEGLSSPAPEKASSISGDGRRYDYIVVGGGTAGCPLAATLSRNFSVLLLERGGSPYGNVNISYMHNFHISLADPSPHSPAQPFVSTDGVINARARVLGGGTCINAGFYSRASPRYIRLSGWDPELSRESYEWIEERIVHRPELVPWQEAIMDGLLQVGVSPFNGFTYDHLTGTKVGGTIFSKDGLRSTAADLLSSASPTNLRVLLHATVHRILLDGSGKEPQALGVEFKDEMGQNHRVYLSDNTKGEVILSSGAIGSSQLLMLSGIGPASQLRKMKIPVLLANEYVGKGMSDNPLNTVFIPTKKNIQQSLIQIVGITNTGSYIEASSGFSQSDESIHCHHGIMSAEIGQLAAVPPKRRSPELVRAYIENKKNLPHELFNGGFILSKIVGPQSVGHLSLVSSNVDDSPSVTFNYFSHPEDLKRCVSGIRIMEKIVRTRQIAELSEDYEYTMSMLLNMTVGANVNFIPKHTNDTQSLEQFCRDTVVTIWHYHGGCHVGKVLDSHYRVLGVLGLRVVDGSVFAGSPGTNPQATVLMFGRYMGIKILREKLGDGAEI